MLTDVSMVVFAAVSGLGIIGGVIALQIHLSKTEGKWPGRVLPIITFFMALMITVSYVSFFVISEMIVMETTMVITAPDGELHEVVVYPGDGPTQTVVARFVGRYGWPYYALLHEHSDGGLDRHLYCLPEKGRTLTKIVDIIHERFCDLEGFVGQFLVHFDIAFARIVGFVVITSDNA